RGEAYDGPHAGAAQRPAEGHEERHVRHSVSKGVVAARQAPKRHAAATRAVRTRYERGDRDQAEADRHESPSRDAPPDRTAVLHVSWFASRKSETRARGFAPLGLGRWELALWRAVASAPHQVGERAGEPCQSECRRASACRGGHATCAFRGATHP